MEYLIKTGKYEYLALETLGLENVATTLDPQLPNSYLSVRNAEVYLKQGLPRLSFELVDDVSDSVLAGIRRTLAVQEVKDHIWPNGQKERLYRTTISVGIQGNSIHNHIWLTRKMVRNTGLVLGANFLTGRISVLLDDAFLLGERVSPCTM
jgi:hypothetical protein